MPNQFIRECTICHNPVDLHIQRNHINGKLVCEQCYNGVMSGSIKFLSQRKQ